MTAMTDMFPSLLRKYRKLFLGCSCIILFFIGLTCATKTGIYYLNLMDSYAGKNPFGNVYNVLIAMINI